MELGLIATLVHFRILQFMKLISHVGIIGEGETLTFFFLKIILSYLLFQLGYEMASTYRNVYIGTGLAIMRLAIKLVESLVHF
jgi:hypothetical protein